MTNKTALILAVMIVAAISLDQYFDWGRTEFMIRKFFAFREYITFWR